MQQPSLNLAPSFTPTLDNFIAHGNQEVISHLQAWLSNTPPHPLIYLWGSSGSGKSHLAQGLQKPRINLSEAISSWENLKNEQYLILENIHQYPANHSSQLFLLIHERLQNNLPLLITSQFPPQKLPFISDINSRLQWGLVLHLNELSDEEKTRALQQQAHIKGIEIPDLVAIYLLQHAHRNINFLFSYLSFLDEWTLAKHRHILTIPLIRDTLPYFQSLHSHDIP